MVCVIKHIPLTVLTQKSKTFDWGEEQENAFQTLKDKLCNAPVLTLPDGPKDFVVYCNASSLGLGYVLMQRGKAIAYASRQLKIHEKKNYTTYDFEQGVRRWIELFSDYDCDIRYHPSKANVVADALRLQKGLDEMIELRNDGALYWWTSMKKDIVVYEGIAMDFVTKLPRTSSGHDTICVIVNRLTKSAHFLPMREDYKMERVARPYLNEIVARHGVAISIISDCDSRFKSMFWQLMPEAFGTRLDMSTAYYPQTDGKSERTIQTLEDMLRVGEGQLIGPGLVQETTEKISQIKDRLKAARDRQKSVVRFGKKGKLAPRFVGPFEIIEKVGLVAYMLDFLEELDGVHDTFNVSNLKKCLADSILQVPLDEIQVDAKLNFVEEPVKFLEREFKKLKRSRIAIVKVR
ncbi:putative reverse transcriptase domain-containing protein [Tanacetum coccineum]|uniref:Reverse transcriptase domain-containing protein n=1 Tax=Tanacetum coccineum TaxID=301880 RepID=A0ABQ4YPV1_9ASTR